VELPAMLEVAGVPGGLRVGPLGWTPASVWTPLRMILLWPETKAFGQRRESSENA
jgi:hypothetical protein